MKRQAVVLVIAILFLLVTGCGNKTKIDTGNGNVSIDKNGVTVKTDDGKSDISVGAEGQVSLPKGYPNDIVPLVDGAKVIAALRNEDADKKISYWITAVSSKEVQEIQQFYEKVLEGATQTSNTQTPDGFYFTGVKGKNNFSVSVTSEEQDGKKQRAINLVIVVEP